MATYKQIQSAHDLPAMGARESTALDFKAKPANLTYDRAKDMAAFANSMGGVLVIGASDKNDTLVGWAPLGEADAKAASKAYEQSARDECSPAPLVSCFAFRRDEGPEVPVDNWALAVNVEPFPGQPVGVRVDAHKKKNGYGGNEAYTFPWRTGTNTIYLTPSQLSMWMIPELRRIQTLLEQIGPEETFEVQINRDTRPLCTRLQVDPLTNTLGYLTGESRELRHVPISNVRDVWRGVDHWIVALHPSRVNISNRPR